VVVVAAAIGLLLDRIDLVNKLVVLDPAVAAGAAGGRFSLSASLLLLDFTFFEADFDLVIIDDLFVLLLDVDDKPNSFRFVPVEEDNDDDALDVDGASEALLLLFLLSRFVLIRFACSSL
jgi:hypothetical protein